VSKKHRRSPVRETAGRKGGLDKHALVLISVGKKLSVRSIWHARRALRGLHVNNGDLNWRNRKNMRMSQIHMVIERKVKTDRGN
jgi:hypothetical protein